MAVPAGDARRRATSGPPTSSSGCAGCVRPAAADAVEGAAHRGGGAGAAAAGWRRAARGSATCCATRTTARTRSRRSPLLALREPELPDDVQHAAHQRGGTSALLPPPDHVLAPGDQLLLAGTARRPSRAQQHDGRRRHRRVRRQRRAVPSSWLWRRLSGRRDVRPRGVALGSAQGAGAPPEQEVECARGARRGREGQGAAVAVETVLVPDPGPGEALVQVQACGVCHTDLHYREGGINDDFPFLLGHEAAGVVEAVGEGVTDVAPGRLRRPQLARGVRASAGPASAAGPWLCFATHNATQKMTLADGTVLSPALGIGAFAEKTLVAARPVHQGRPGAPTRPPPACSAAASWPAGARRSTPPPSSRATPSRSSAAAASGTRRSPARCTPARARSSPSTSTPASSSWATGFGATHTVDASSERRRRPAARADRRLRPRRRHRRGRPARDVPAGVRRPRPRRHGRARRRPRPDDDLRGPADRGLRARRRASRAPGTATACPSATSRCSSTCGSRAASRSTAFVSERIALDDVEEAFHRMERGEVLRVGGGPVTARVEHLVTSGTFSLDGADLRRRQQRLAARRRRRGARHRRAARRRTRSRRRSATARSSPSPARTRTTTTSASAPELAERLSRRCCCTPTTGCCGTSPTRGTSRTARCATAWCSRSPARRCTCCTPRATRPARSASRCPTSGSCSPATRCSPGGPGATGRSYSDYPTILDSIRTRLFALPPETVVHTGHGDEHHAWARRRRRTTSGYAAAREPPPPRPPACTRCWPAAGARGGSTPTHVLTRDDLAAAARGGPLGAARRQHPADPLGRSTLRGEPLHARLVGALKRGNRTWAPRAAALLVAVALPRTPRPGGLPLRPARRRAGRRPPVAAGRGGGAAGAPDGRVRRRTPYAGRCGLTGPAGARRRRGGRRRGRRRRCRRAAWPRGRPQPRTRLPLVELLLDGGARRRRRRPRRRARAGSAASTSPRCEVGGRPLLDRVLAAAPGRGPRGSSWGRPRELPEPDVGG